jgi:glutamate/tyrosine decarboxylase-like PLP-dependent enzyme
VCAQAGNVNTGAFDPLGEIAARLRGTGAWIHVDGAFGLWAAAAPAKRELTAGIDLVDSIATDAHKWLNVPYDSGLVFVRDPRALNAAMRPALPTSSQAKRAIPHVRARHVASCTRYRSLGRAALAGPAWPGGSDRAQLQPTQALRERVAQSGHQVLNDVVLNQVRSFLFGTPERTRRVIAAIQQDGTCLVRRHLVAGKTLRCAISVRRWRRTDADVAQSIEAILRCAQ